METAIVVGAPIFGNDPARLTFCAALGHQEIYERIRSETQEPKEIAKNLFMEYSAILFALQDMGISFSIAFAHQELMYAGLRERLEEEGFEFVPFPTVSAESIAFPRDFAVQLPGNLSLIDSDLSELIFPENVNGYRVIKSPYGQGGRIHIRKQVALVHQKIFFEYGGSIAGDAPQLKPLHEAGVAVGLLPNPIRWAYREKKWAYVPDDHIDRISGLLEDRKGNMHLIVDPHVHSGYLGPFSKPKVGPHKTIEQYKRVCATIGVKLHVPRKLSVPLSFGFMQFDTGQVLMTSGDEEVLRIVADIVGEENVFVTIVPIMHYPAWNHAGIHCLIGEIPHWILTFYKEKLWNVAS